MSEFDKMMDKVAKRMIKKAKSLEDRPKRRIAFSAAMLSVYGWQLSIPVVLGIILGRLLDQYIPIDGLSWTLNVILMGFLIGIYNANMWLNKHMKHKSPPLKKERKK